MDLAKPRFSFRRRLPTRVRHRLKSILRSAEGRRLGGDDVTCPICDGSFKSFLPRKGKPNVQCPRCWSLVRHRSLWLFLRDTLHLGDRPVRLLHFAPEAGIQRRIRALAAIDYTCGDIDAALADDRIDIVALPYPDQSFDLVLCSHVLEHVPDDRAAIRELRRILRPDGTVIVVVPIKTDRTVEYLDPSAQPAHADGYRRKGPHGHVRLVGADYVARLEESGFEVELVDHAASLSETERARYGLTVGQPLFVCTVGEIARRDHGSAAVAISA